MPRRTSSQRHALALRPIAIHVEETAAGSFEWVLRERGAGGDWAELDRASSPAPTYRQAMADGLLVLQGLAQDLDAGPRREGVAAPAPAAAARSAGARGAGAAAEEDEDEDEGEDVKDEADAAAGGASDAPPARKRAFFGFGPAR